MAKKKDWIEELKKKIKEKEEETEDELEELEEKVIKETPTNQPIFDSDLSFQSDLQVVPNRLDEELQTTDVKEDEKKYDDGAGVGYVQREEEEGKGYFSQRQQEGVAREIRSFSRQVESRPEPTMHVGSRIREAGFGDRMWREEGGGSRDRLDIEMETPEQPGSTFYEGRFKGSEPREHKTKKYIHRE
ncbi:MAG: hypothetical protein ABH817_02205 [archaeon]